MGEVERDKAIHQYPKNKAIFHFIRCGALLFVFLSVAWLLYDVVQQQRHHMIIDNFTVAKSAFTVGPTCDDPSLSVYVYTLPPQFNLGLLDQCSNLRMHINMCAEVANSGLGQPLITPNVSSTSWFATNQFTAEIIFHARVLNHPCRTWDPARANLFYVPFYGGFYSLKTFEEPNATARNELAVGLADYIQAQPTWQKYNGRDHFMTLGTVVWNFMGNYINVSYDNGANSLLTLPAMKNMSALIIETHPPLSNQHGIPYPSYFHPSTWQEMVTWQNKMRRLERPHLFSFVGAPRNYEGNIRNDLIRQCSESTLCFLLNCAGSGKAKCWQASEVLRVMTESVFCLQPPGDTATRRSTFDSVLAGCIPVFFSPHTAYTQYAWFLPEDVSTYSVYLDQKSIINASKRIEDELMKIPSDKVEMMRENIIDLIPSLTYAHPNATNLGFKDAVDVALVSLVNLVNKLN